MCAVSSGSFQPDNITFFRPYFSVGANIILQEPQSLKNDVCLLRQKTALCFKTELEVFLKILLKLHLTRILDFPQHLLS